MKAVPDRQTMTGRQESAFRASKPAVVASKEQNGQPAPRLWGSRRLLSVPRSRLLNLLLAHTAATERASLLFLSNTNAVSTTEVHRGNCECPRMMTFAAEAAGHQGPLPTKTKAAVLGKRGMETVNQGKASWGYH